MITLFYAPHTCSLASHIALQDAAECGETYTICDPCLVTMAQWLEQDGVDPARFPEAMGHRSQMSARPEVQKALAAELWPEACPARGARLRSPAPRSGHSRARL